MNKEMLNLLKKKKELINQIITIREKTNYYELNNLLLISKKYLKDNNDTLILSEYINKINKKLKTLESEKNLTIEEIKKICSHQILIDERKENNYIYPNYIYCPICNSFLEDIPPSSRHIITGKVKNDFSIDYEILSDTDKLEEFLTKLEYTENIQILRRY